MTGQPVLDVAFGLVFVFLVFSLICSGVNEFISRVLAKRARFLEAGIWELLDPAAPNTSMEPMSPGIELHRRDLFKNFWEHPLVAQLGRPVATGKIHKALLTISQLLARPFRGPQQRAIDRRRQEARASVGLDEPVSPTKRPSTKGGSRVIPAYISSRTFALVIEDLFDNGSVGGSALDALLRTTGEATAKLRDGATPKKPATSVISRLSKQVREYIAYLERRPAEDLPGALTEGLKERRAAIEAWFDGQMERVSAWYKRETKTILCALALIIVPVMNVDSIAIARTLWSDPTVRDFVARTAQQQLDEAKAADTPEQQEKEWAAGTAGSNTPNTATTATTKPVPTTTTTHVPPLNCSPPTTSTSTPTLTPSTTTTMPKSLADLKAADECARLLRGGGLPIGWPTPALCHRNSKPEHDVKHPETRCGNWWDRVEDAWLTKWRGGWATLLLTLLGWALSVGALSMGAPFWWDQLNRLGSLRTAGQKPKPSTS